MEQDVTEHKQFREMAYHDALTGLPNRRLFDLEAESAVTLANREGWSLALLYLDLDEFKPVNDRFGHEVGDLLLKQVAARLQMILRSSDLLARIGGDEFIVLLQHTNNRRTSDICDRILKTLAAPFNVEGHSIHIGISIGVALCPNHSTSLETLKSYADSAMYRAKTQKAGIDIYSSTSRHIANLAQNFK
jgi:diguanylate cyclase (GGDEF)-like protein